METLRPLKVLIKAAKAPAQVTPLMMESRTPYFTLRRSSSSNTILSVPLAPVAR